jgi:prepilin peptidase CpaA
MWSVVIAASLAAAIGDLRRRRISNRLTGSLLLVGVLWAFWTEGLYGLADSVSASLLLMIPYILLFLFAGGGAGDAKLMGAIGAWVGLVNGLVVLGAVSGAAVVLGALYAITKNRVRAVLTNLTHIVFRTVCFVQGVGLGDRTDDVVEEKHELPYGVVIFVGVCVAAGGTMIWRMYV